MTDAYCIQCGKVTPHQHTHDCAHGIPETHMAGSERYVCSVCRWSIHRHEAVGENAHLKFILDKDGS